MTSYDDLTFKEKTDKKARFNKLAAEIDATAAGDSSIAEDVSALKTTVGKASGDGAGGLAKDVADLKTAVGDNSSGLTKDVADVKTAIGDESTEGTILARIKALEDAP